MVFQSVEMHKRHQTDTCSRAKMITITEESTFCHGFILAFLS